MPWKNGSVRGQRLELVRALLRGDERRADICERFKVSRQTASKYRRRWLQLGPAGLDDQSRRPHKSMALAEQWRRRLLRLRRDYPHWGARKLRWLLGQRFIGRRPAERTLQRWLAAAGQVQQRRARPRRVVFSKNVTATSARRPNDVWTIDLKGWFRTKGGQRVEPLTIRDLASRYLLWTRHLAPRSERSIKAVCLRLFERHGRPKVMRCDLGPPFFGRGPHGFSRLSLWWWRLGIRVEFVRRGAIHNNEHEQMHQVLSAEVPLAATLSAQARALERWRHEYNHDRPHDALGLRPPATVYRSQPAALPRLPPPKYPAGWMVRRVRRHGSITIPGWTGTLGRAFASLPVAFKPVSPHIYHLYFDALFLGELDLKGARKLVLSPAPPNPQPAGG